MRGFTVHSACPAEIDVLSTAVTREGRWVVLPEGGRTASAFSLRTRRLLAPDFGMPNAVPCLWRP
jgi:hypothetical protein